jgi:Fic family protein
MFSPNFKYTNDIVNNLVSIFTAREVIMGSPIVPQWEVKLRREALVASAHASTSIEGNPLSLKEVSLLAEGREVMATRRAKQEVINYLDVLQDIGRYHTKGTIGEEDILKLHRDVSHGVLDKPKYEGRYRDVVVVVGNRRTGEITFLPPEPKDVPRLMGQFVRWLDSDERRQFNPVLAAGIAHYEFVRIHPFVDGNGRTARALATVVLAAQNFDIKRFFALDDFYDADRQAYYEALSSVDKETRDLTRWLEYFTGGVLVSISRVRERIIEISVNGQGDGTGKQISLTDRQMKVYEYIVRNGKATNKDISSLSGFSPQAAYKVLDHMVDLGLLKRKGRGRASYYVRA